MAGRRKICAGGKVPLNRLGVQFFDVIALKKPAKAAKTHALAASHPAVTDFARGTQPVALVTRHQPEWLQLHRS